MAEAGRVGLSISGPASPLETIGNRQRISPALEFLIFAGILLSILALHLPLLRIPYIWDEGGYYIPAARDLFLSGSLIPRSTVSNAHPPLVMAWLAAAWKLAGFTPLVTRVAMLAVAAFALLGVFRLAALVAHTEVAVASTVCTALYPVFFAQSSLAHVDMAAAGFSLWGLRSYLDKRRWATLMWFSAAALAKETAIIAPLALAAWEIVSRLLGRPLKFVDTRRYAKSGFAFLIASVVPLAIWFVYHYVRTGYVFGNPEFFRYNVTATLHPVRIVLAAGMRVWQLIGYMHLWLLTIAAALAMLVPPQSRPGFIRPRIALPVQAAFLVLIISYVMAMAVIGGAILARYMLPVLPLVIILCVSTLWRRVQYWRVVIAIVCAAFIAAWFFNPPYGFPFEDNLAYRDYALLHEGAEQWLVTSRPDARVLTAWPASDELTRPYLGYVTAPLRVLRIEDFSFEHVTSAVDARSRFDVALIFSTKYEPPHPLLRPWQPWERVKERYFGFHHDLRPDLAGRVLGGDVVYSAARNGQWIAVIDVPHVVEAALPTISFASGVQQMTGMGFHDQPNIITGLQAQGIPRCQR